MRGWPKGVAYRLSPPSRVPRIDLSNEREPAMKITIKGRARDLKTPINGIENTREGDIVVFASGPKGEPVKLTLSEGELSRIVSSQAPYGHAQRSAYFARLRAEADNRHPPHRY